jgi:hypothetical protein
MPELSTLHSPPAQQLPHDDAATPVDTPENDTIEVLIEAAAQAHERVCSAGLTMLEEAFAAGEMLLKLKDKVDHGEFGTHLHGTGISQRTAQAYMRLAKHRELIEAKAQSVAHLGVGAALRLIAKPKDDADAEPEPDEQSGGNGTDADEHEGGGGDGRSSEDDPLAAEIAARRAQHAELFGADEQGEPTGSSDNGGGAAVHGDDAADDESEEPAQPPPSPLRAYWPTATTQERRELFDVVSVDDFLSVAPVPLCRALADRLVIHGTKRSAKATKYVKTALKSRRPAEQFTALAKAKDAIGDDEFEVRVRSSGTRD